MTEMRRERTRSQLGIDVEQAPNTVFVGRDNEIGFLRGALTRARDEREPQLVTLVGFRAWASPGSCTSGAASSTKTRSRSPGGKAGACPTATA